MKKVCLLLILLTVLVSCAELEAYTNVALEELVQEEQQVIPYNLTDEVTFASFNVQTLGKKKISDPFVRDYLPKIIRRYDIVAVQELRDSSTVTLNELQALLPEYEMVVSGRLGRTISKEQYILFYRRGEVLSTHTWEDKKDVFEREPQVVTFKVANLTFDIINIHVKPSDATNEVIALKQVIKEEVLADEKFLLVGDFNADCSYYDEELEHLQEYYWAIDDTQDTTVSNNYCTYDRIISNFITQGYVFNYQEYYNFTQEQAKDISDHFPVWAVIE